MIDVYSDYLITAFGQVSATNLARSLNHTISHDQITRFLAEQELSSRDYWKLIKPELRRIQQPNGIVIIDDFIIPKPHSNENGTVAYHFDHTSNQSIRGINVVDATYVTDLGEVPLDFEVIQKFPYQVDLKTGKPFREQLRSKQEIYQRFLEHAVQNNVPFEMVLNDVWYSSTANMILVKRELGKEFIMPVKSNRRVKLSNDKHYQAVSELALPENQAVDARIEGVPFLVRLVKAVFRNEDDSIGVLYLVSSVLDLDGEALVAAYQQRWRIEVQHKRLKQEASITKSPVQLVLGRVNHVFCAFVGVMKLGVLATKTGVGQTALRNQLLIVALRASRAELMRLRGDSSSSALQPA